MSNDSNIRNIQPISDLSVPAALDLKQSQKQKWNQACDDLKNAMSSWDDLSLNVQRPSSEELRILEMRSLLCELKTKLDELSLYP